MNRIIQHVPKWSSMEAQSAEFETQADMLDVEWVSNWTDGDGKRPFHRFSMSETTLIAELSNGAWWWAVGHISQPELIDLPIWSAK